jgi:hypothetical protein
MRCVAASLHSQSQCDIVTRWIRGIGAAEEVNEGGGGTLKSLSATANKKFTLKSSTAASNIASVLSGEGVVLGDLVMELV